LNGTRRLCGNGFAAIAQEGRHWPGPWNVAQLLADPKGIEYNLRQLKRELQLPGYGGDLVRGLGAAGLRPPECVQVRHGRGGVPGDVVPNGLQQPADEEPLGFVIPPALDQLAQVEREDEMGTVTMSVMAVGDGVFD
jgi:hypothetical protein